MLNGMLDFGDDDGISGFVGGGVGMARVKANNYRNFANATPFLDGSDSRLPGRSSPAFVRRSATISTSR
jgi:opacity protein-like surface antigen